MDPITGAIVAAVAAGISKVGGSAVADAYQGLKALLKRKFGDRISAAVDDVEARPNSAGAKGDLQDAVAETKADQDTEVLKAVETLVARMGGEGHVMSIIGDYNAQADRGGHASVNVNQPPKRTDG